MKDFILEGERARGQESRGAVARRRWNGEVLADTTTPRQESR